MTAQSTEVWKVDGMTCGGCAASVERSLANAAGLVSAKADAAADTVTLTVDAASVDRDDLAARIERAGFDVVARG